MYDAKHRRRRNTFVVCSSVMAYEFGAISVVVTPAPLGLIIASASVPPGVMDVDGTVMYVHRV